MLVTAHLKHHNRTTHIWNAKGVYENGVFVGSISYFNTQLQEYLVKFDDGSEDYICEDDIDGVELILM